jgi:hypothetical protein
VLSPRGVARIGLALTVAFVLGSVALAGPKEDVSAATSERGRALGEDHPDKVLPFYADDAGGTLSPMVRANRVVTQASRGKAFSEGCRRIPVLPRTHSRRF